MKFRKITSFDKTESSFCEYQKPDKYNDLFRLLQKPTSIRGAGLSYCNASVSSDNMCIDMTSFDRILSFDSANGSIMAEAGISVGKLNNFLIDNGWLMPVLPGYPLITLGGCIAFNIHGKSQYKIGTFGDWVEELVIYHPDNGEVICSRDINNDLFEITIGGMGFTGIILSARLRLKKINGNQLHIKTIRTANLYEAVSIMKDNSGTFEYVYSWNNFNLKGNSFGKGIVYLEKVGNEFQRKAPIHFKNRLSLKKTPCLLNDFTIGIMCRLYPVLDRLKPRVRKSDLYKGSFPIYGKEIYYKLFGTKGFREYQVLFSDEAWPEASRKIENLIEEQKVPITLASIKLFKGNTHYVSLSGDGVCLAMDVVNNQKGLRFFDHLDNITLQYKGIINLSKDSRAKKEFIKRSFTGFDSFKESISKIDPRRSFVSNLRNRMEV